MNENITSIQELPLWFWIVLIPALIIQGTCIFLHARKHGHYPWLWALWGFISIPMPSLLYVLCVVRPWRRDRSS